MQNVGKRACKNAAFLRGGHLQRVYRHVLAQTLCLCTQTFPLSVCHPLISTSFVTLPTPAWSRAATGLSLRRVMMMSRGFCREPMPSSCDNVCAIARPPKERRKETVAVKNGSQGPQFNSYRLRVNKLELELGPQANPGQRACLRWGR